MAPPVSVKFVWNGLSSKSIWISQGMSVTELTKTVCASLGLPESSLAGLQYNGKMVRFQDICQQPSLFSGSVISIVVRDDVDDEEDTDGDDDAFPSVFTLSPVEIRRLATIFNSNCKDEMISWEEFLKCFRQFARYSDIFKNMNQQVLTTVLQNLFLVFDQEENDVIDSTEFLSGLTVLCNGTRDEKIQIAFDLYDSDRNGYISRAEMRRYLRSVFIVMRETSSEIFDRYRVSPDELASITADQCFSDCDTDRDGMLSFEEFKNWYTADNVHVTKDESAEVLSLTDLSKLLSFDTLQVVEVLGWFSQAAHSGTLDRTRFGETYKMMLRRRGLAPAPEIEYLLDQVFSVFDQDGNGLVNFEELGAGLSILCKGTRDDKVRAAFALYDTNNDGFISLDEMSKYMTSVFRMLYETQAGVRESMNNVDPEDLGEITANQCFLEADLDKDGRLSFEEFKRWYSEPTASKQITYDKDPSSLRMADRNISLQDVRRVTGLDSMHTFEVFQFFGSRARNGTVSREAFRNAFEDIRSRTGRASRASSRDDQIFDMVVERLFILFDNDQSGFLDFGELATGLTVICVKKEDEAVRETFRLFDSDGDGFISRDEMIRYLTSVYKIYFDLSESDVDPVELAIITTEECFIEADTNMDGKLSFSEFTRWYKGDESTKSISMAAAKEVTGLGSITLSDAFDAFLDSTEPGEDDTSMVLTRQSFGNVVYSLAPSDVDESMLAYTIDILFSAFDQDQNGCVDFNELLSGLSILCEASPQEKTSVAFSLFDTNGDGFISKEELIKYLASVYRIMYQLESSIKSQANGLSPYRLALVTCDDIFAEYDTNRDGKLNHDEFVRWFSPSTKPETEPSDSGNIDMLRQLTRLSMFRPDQAFAIFAKHADTQGNISAKAFKLAFKEIFIISGDPPSRKEYEVLKPLLRRLFELFDSDGNGTVDFAELGSGLSVLCGGSDTSRAECAFDLYDVNGDGYISRDEMIRYLTCVFKVMYEMQPSIATQTGGIPPEELGEVTADNIFLEADLNHDGKLSFGEFEKWYKGETGRELSVAADFMAEDPSWFSLDEIRRLTNLNSYAAQDIMQLFEKVSEETVPRAKAGRMQRFNSSRVISRQAFDSVFTNIVNESACTTKDDFVKLTFIMDRLYDMFDIDNNGEVNLHELGAGLAVLCGGNQDSKILASFNLFDQDGDGSITLDEMESYLASVYRVLYASQPEVQQKVRGLSPEQLAEVTARQCFAEADSNSDGKLTFEEFRAWYTRPSGQVINTIVTNANVPVLTIADIRAVTRLDRFAADEIKDQVMAYANAEGLVDRSGFLSAFEEILEETLSGSSLSASEISRIEAVLNKMFDLFDADKSGFVDYFELTAGLSIMCGGSQEDKMKIAFDNYDVDGTGTITQDEMVRYLTAVFRVMYETKPGTEERMGCGADELAIITAESIFDEADLNGDGELDFEEFKRWYASENAAGVTEIVNVAPSWLSLASIRSLTRLDQYTPSDVFEHFAKRSQNGEIDRQTFGRCFREIALLKPPPMSSADMDKLHLVMNRLFDAFDVNKSGAVEFTELVSGLSVLCGGNKDVKAEAAFSLYDYNGDGFISFKEMLSYLTAVFRVMFELEPRSKQNLPPNTTPAMIAEATTHRIFAEADTNQDGRLSFDEFRKWYNESAVPPPPPPTKVTLNLETARHLTGLGTVEVSEVFEEFAQLADERGQFDKQAFIDCFVPYVVTHVSSENRQAAFQVVDMLFELFDQDGNGQIDFIELASGLTLLCGGSIDSKCKAIFDLYDHDSTGRISKENMVWYLTSVFTLIFESRPGTREQMGGISAEELAKATVDEVFADADLNQDGYLTYAEFSAWYNSTETSPAFDVVQGAPDLITIDDIRNVTGFDKYSQEELFEEFAVAADEDGLISEDIFQSVCFDLIDVDAMNQNAMDRLIFVLARLFRIFDADRNGHVDFSELVTGVGILCSGSRDQKARTAFALYDLDGDGYISLDEMVRYLLAIYKFMYETQPGVQELAGNASPEELAVVTAAQMFADADTDMDGQLSFEEFQRWYSESNPPANMPAPPPPPKQRPQRANSAPSPDERPLSLSEIKRITGLGSRDVHEVIEEFAAYSNDEGVLTRSTFNAAFDKVTADTAADNSDVELLASIRNRLFNIFDMDGNGLVDFSEIATGLSILCDGNRHMKTRAAFALYDANGDGYISREELVVYLTCVFKIMYDTDVSGASWTAEVSPEQIAFATANDIFESADKDRDNRLSYDEFQSWYENNIDARALDTIEETLDVNISIEEARRVTGFGSVSPQDVIQEFAMVTAEDGTISVEDFTNTFKRFCVRSGSTTTEDMVKQDIIISRLFNVFDVDRNGKIDYSELASGLSILCSGEKEDKVRAAFALFDVNGDGFISVAEMETYLLSVFRVWFELMPSTKEQLAGVSAEELAEATTAQCFSEADIDHDGRLSFEEFRMWFSSNGGDFFRDVPADSHPEETVPSQNDLKEIKRLTKLDQTNVAAVMALIEEVTGGEPTLSFEDFVTVFEMIIELGGGHRTPEDDVAAMGVVRQLFDLFDLDNNGVVDFRELSAGLSVLCAGSRDEKVASAFLLFDNDGDGYISLEEMVTYLTSVFRMLYSAQPEMATSMEVSPEQLGVITAEQCFLEADTNRDGRLSFQEFKEWYAGQY